MTRHSVEEVEARLLSSGRKLNQPPSSPEQIISILDGTDKYLSKVEQSPPASIVTALAPLTKALVSDKLLKHSDIDVRVGVASCISEITRITAPEAPYDDDQMKDVLQLIVSSFENLSDTSSVSYPKRVSILETVAKVRSCVIMLDLECDQLVIEMFQHFLRDIRDHHAEVVLNSMETIMTLILEESEDISPSILYPILSALEKNKTVRPVAKKLAEKVIQSAADKLRTCLPQALKALNANVNDYSEVLASMCQDSIGNVLNGESEVKESTDETATNCANEPETEEIVVNGANETEKTATNGANEPETGEIAADGANEPETGETAADGANEPETEETATDGANEPETEETATDGANESDAEETVTSDANEPEAEETVVDAICSKNEDSKIVSDANLVSEEPAALEAKVDQVAKENGGQSNSDNDSTESPDFDSKKQSEQVNTSEDVPTSPNEVLPLVEEAISSDNVKDTCMQLSPSEPHENEDENVSTPVQVGSLPEPSQVKKSARTKRKGKSAKKQKRTGKKQPAKKDIKIEEDESKKDDDNAPSDSDTKSLDQTEKIKVSDEDNNSGAKEQDSEEKPCTKKADKKSNSTEGSKSKNDGGNASESETNSLDQTEKLKVPDEESIPISKLQKGRGKKQPAKKAKADSTLVEEDESKNDNGNASDSEAMSVEKTVNQKVSDEESLPVAKKQRSTKKQPAKKAKKNVELVEENESENNGGGDSEMREDSSLRKVGKKIGVNPSSEKDGSKSSVREDDGEDMVTSPRSPLRSTRDVSNKEKSPRMSSKRKRTPGTGKASGTIEYGEELVGSKVKVYWPQDRKFYPGVVHSYDSVKKKHAVLYADGDQENLNLKREKWELVEDEPASDAAVEDSSDDASPDMKKKKGANSEASSKQKSSAKATGKSKSKDVTKTPNSSKQDTQKTAKSKAKTPQTATGSSKSGSSKAKAADKEIVKGKSQDTPKSRASEAKSGKKRRR